MAYSRLDLTGRVAVVIGGTSGIGRAIGHGLAEAGAEVVPTSRRAEQVEAAAREIEDRGRRTLRITSDVSDRSSLEKVLDQSIAAFGKVDIVVNSAGRTKRAPTLEFPEADWNEIFETNVTGTLRACQVFGRHMIERGYGRIINVSSSAGRTVSTLGGAHYTASKAGLLGLTRASAKELGKFGITVNAICPGMIDTELTHENASPELLEHLASGYPVPRLGTPLEVADLICFAASEAAGYLTGTSLDINGGDLMM